MNDRVGQVWLSRKRKIAADFELYVVIRLRPMMVENDPWSVVWVLRPLERLDDHKEEITHFETQFKLAERGRDDAWLKMRVA